jgi:hypothetical protein
MGLERALDEITETDLQELVDNQVAERRSIDYKLELKFSSDSERKEFLFDIASFGTVMGGHLLYGVEEAGGFPQKLVGIEVQDEDELILKIESMVRDGIAPRLRVEARVVPLSTGKSIVLLRVPASWSRPHMVTFKGTNKFYGRDSRGKYPLEVGEIGAAFTLGHTLGEKIRAFRVERVARILAGRTHPRLQDGPTVVLHLVPADALASTTKLRPLPRVDDVGNLRPMRSGGWNPKTNADGIMCHGGAWGGDEAPTYVQLFRNGVIEAAKSWADPMEPEPTLPSIAYEEAVFDVLPLYLGVQRELGVSPPIFVMVTIARVAGMRMGLSARENTWGEDEPFRESELLLPEGVLESFDQAAGPLLKATFDIVWNAVGLPRSLNFDDDGKWVNRR